MRKIDPKILERLKHEALVESIGSSLRLAGREISNRKVREICDPLSTLALAPTKILKLLHNTPRLKMADFIAMTEYSRDLLKYHLKELVKKNLIKQYGKGRGTWYTLS